MKTKTTTKSIWFLFVIAILISGCASFTVFETSPSGATVHANGQLLGTTPIFYSDTKIAFSSTPITFSKDGYHNLNIILKRNEKADVGAILGGFFLGGITWLWFMEYDPTHSYELIELESNTQTERLINDVKNKVPPISDNKQESSRKVIDIDGNVYNYVVIGTQVWMKENLKTTKYNDGTTIPNVTDNTEWENLATGAYCWYDNDISHKTSYGALYNWYAVETSKLCPIGWHVSSSMDWMKLLNHLGGYQIAGNKLKEPGIAHWGSPNNRATNKSGFSALAGGWRDSGGSFQFLKGVGYWWTSTYVPGPSPIPVSPGDQCGPWMIVMFGGQSSVKSNNPFPKVMGFSIRCIKD